VVHTESEWDCDGEMWEMADRVTETGLAADCAVVETQVSSDRVQMERVRSFGRRRKVVQGGTVGCGQVQGALRSGKCSAARQALVVCRAVCFSAAIAPVWDGVRTASVRTSESAKRGGEKDVREVRRSIWMVGYFRTARRWFCSR